MATSDIITVARDPSRPLGKQFGLGPSGKLVKKSTVSVAVAEAVQHHVPDVFALRTLLTAVGDDPHAAIINSKFPMIPVGVPFLLLSEKEFRKIGIERFDKSITWPVPIWYAEVDWPALGRFKEHTAPSSWQLLDRDVDEYTPQYYAELDYDGWLVEVDKLLPGVRQCARLRAHSSSARVCINGKPVGGGNGHTWIQLRDASDVERLRSVTKARAIAMGMAWKKPRHSQETGEVVGHDVVSIVDWSVFTPGRLVFVGKPEVLRV